MPDIVLEPLPKRFGRDYCEHYYHEARKRLRPSGGGRHEQLFRGQSMEFRDFKEYTPGDDSRMIDHRASARYRLDDDNYYRYLVRSFAAEEAFKLAISLDTRASMYYPEKQKKIQQATWLAEVLGRIALYAGDHVYLHRLFGSPSPAQSFERPMSQARLFPWLQQNTYQPAEEHLNLASLRQVIYPVAAWVVISDFYWEAESPIASQLAHFVREADEGWRWVILINLNSWPYECNLLTGGSGDPSWNIEGPGLTPQDHVEIDNSHLLNDVKDRIEVAQKNFLKQAHRKVFDSIWNWGINPEILPENAFHQCFEQDKHLKQLFEMPS